MKNIYLSIIFCLIYSVSQGQSNIYNFLLAGEDTNFLLEQYTSPIIRGIGNGVNNGWYNTAKAHKTLGGEILFTANLAYFNDGEQFYSVPASGLPGGTTLLSPTDGNAPTVIGPAITPVFENNGVVFDGPEGADVKSDVGGFVPTPMVQIGLGVYKKTDIKFRFLPEQKIGDDGKISMIGFGLLHDIGQHFKGVKELPLDISLFAGYTSLKSTVDYSNNSGIGTSNDQQGVYNGNSWTFQALVSKKLSIITLYGGLGYDKTDINYKMEGTYDFGNSIVFTNPVDMNFDVSGMRGTAGVRLNIAFFKLWADYTLKDQNVLTVGLGFAFREDNK